MDYKNRSEVPLEYKWDLSKWFKSDEIWEENFKKAEEKVNYLKTYKGKLFESNNLYEALKFYYEYENELEKLFAYAMLKQDEDLSKSKYEKMYSRILNLVNKFEENAAFFMPEILHSEEFDVQKLILKNPDLKSYEYVLKTLELEKEHVKDEETEKTISLLLSDLYNHENLSSNLLNSNINYGNIIGEDGKKVELNSGNYSKFMTSSDRNIRKKSYISINKPRVQFSSTLGKNLIAYMTRETNVAKIRNYKSSMEKFFEPSQIPISVYEKLIEKTHENLKFYQKYNKMVKNYLGVQTLEVYDLNAPIVDFDKKYSVEDAQKYCVESVKILGEEYQSIMQKGFDEKWIDFMPYKGKASGGYCMSVHGVTSNICMNYNENFNGISTLAHEMGHAINFYYANKVDLQSSRHSNYIGEIPSLFNEILLANYVIDGDFSKKEKSYVIANLLNTINSNFFGAVMESELENIVYKKLDNEESISSEDLTDIARKLQKEYYGSTVKLNKYSPYLWTRRSHYFIPWYLYKYSTCLLGAVYFASKILNGDSGALQKYLEFIKAPNNDFPDQILKNNGIDLNSDEIYEEFFVYYDSLLEKLEENMK